MYKFFKKLSFYFLVFFGLILCVGVATTHFLGDKIVSIILKELNNQIRGEINVQEIDFTLLKKFPNASIELTNIVAMSSPNINKKDFKVNADTFLLAQKVFLEFSIFDIIKERYRIKNISIENANVKVLIDKKNEYNFSYLKEDETPSQSTSVDVDINSLSIKNTKLLFYDAGRIISSGSYIRNFKLSGRLTKNQQKIMTDGKILINSFIVDNSNIISSKEFDFDIDAINDFVKYSLNKCKITYSNQELLSVGTIMISGDSTIVDLEFDANKIIYHKIKDFIPKSILQQLEKYKLDGTVAFKGQIAGLFYEKIYPSLNIEFATDNSKAVYNNLPVSFSANGVLSSTNIYLPQKYVLNISQLKLNCATTIVEGVFRLQDFNDMKLSSKIYINGKIEDVNKILMTEQEYIVNGDLVGSIIISGSADFSKEYTKKEHDKLKIESAIDIKNLKFKNQQLSINNCNTSLLVSNNNIIIKKSNFDFFSQKTSISGQLNNGLNYLLFDNQELNVDMRIKVEKIDTGFFISKKSIDSQQTENEEADVEFEMPKDVKGSIKIVAEKFIHNNLSADNFSLDLLFSLKKITLENIVCNSMDGTIKSNIIIKELPNKNISLNGRAELNSVNVNKLFLSFDNFEQDFLIDKNLDGILSSDIYFQTAWTNKLEFLEKAFFTEASTQIKNGQLIDFKPIERLSSFVELDELRNISFSTLQNDFVIKDRTIYIPQMAINSSAFNITLSGNHHFDGKFDYRVQLFLNEILSKKRKRKPKESEFFGEVEDDGLGRTKLFLKIVNDNNNTKVSYDRAEAKTVLKQNVQQERQNIREIFRNEFGRKNKNEKEEDDQKSNNMNQEIFNEDEFIFEFDE